MRFADYAAVFGRRDRGGDIVRRGAFARSLARGGGDVPLLWQHDPARPIGRVEYLKEDRRGLRVIGRLADGRAARLLARGAVTGLSFGYRVKASAGEEPRVLSELELVEISLVASPMQPRARVHVVEARLSNTEPFQPTGQIIGTVKDLQDAARGRHGGAGRGMQDRRRISPDVT